MVLTYRSEAPGLDAPTRFTDVAPDATRQDGKALWRPRPNPSDDSQLAAGIENYEVVILGGAR